VDIVVGEAHALILTERGRVWSIGGRHRAALGRGTKVAGGPSAVVPGVERIVQISAGAMFSMCLDIDGRLWLFGEGPCLIGCFNDSAPVYEPKAVPAAAFGGRRILSIASGDGHILVLATWDPDGRLPLAGSSVFDTDYTCDNAKSSGEELSLQLAVGA